MAFLVKSLYFLHHHLHLERQKNAHYNECEKTNNNFYFNVRKYNNMAWRIRLTSALNLLFKLLSMLFGMLLRKLIY